MLFLPVLPGQAGPPSEAQRFVEMSHSRKISELEESSGEVERSTQDQISGQGFASRHFEREDQRQEQYG